MSEFKVIHTDAAPAAIGPYSQAVKTHNTVYLSGQIAFNPNTMELVEGSIKAQAKRVFMNLDAVASAAGGGLSDIARLTIYLIDMKDFTDVNQVMKEYFSEPYPARVTVGVSQLPKGARIEVDAVMVM